MHLGFSVIHCFQVRRNLQRMVQRHFQFSRNQLGHLIHVLVRHTHHAADIAHGGTGGHSSKGHDLCHMVTAILAVDVINHFLAALVTKVNVKVRHRDTFRVQEAFKNQTVADGVNVRNTDTIGRQAARTGAAAGADRDIAAFGVIDKVIHDEVIVGVPHLFNHANLVFQAFTQGIRYLAGVAAFQALITELFKVFLVFHAVRSFEIRELGIAKHKVKVALFCNFVGVLAGFWHHGEQVIHFIGAFYIEFLGLKLHAVHIVDGFAGLDAQQNALHLGVLAGDVVGVVGGNHGDACLPRKADKLRQNGSVFFQAVVLQLNIIVALAEQIVIVKSNLLGALIVPCQNRLRDLTGKAGGKADQAFVVLLQQVMVNARLGIKALQETGGYHFDQVFIPGFIFAEQDQVVVAVNAVDLIKAGAGGNIHLTANDRLDACGFGCIIKGNTAVHNTVVGNGNGGLAQLFDIVKQAVNTAGAIQQAVLSMQVQVGELSLRLVWRGFWHNVSLCCCGKMRKSRSSYAAALRGLLRRWCDVLSCWFRLFKIFLLFRLC